MRTRSGAPCPQLKLSLHLLLALQAVMKARALLHHPRKRLKRKNLLLFSGIGKAAAEELAKRGYALTLTDIDAEGIMRLVSRHGPCMTRASPRHPPVLSRCPAPRSLPVVLLRSVMP